MPYPKGDYASPHIKRPGKGRGIPRQLQRRGLENIVTDDDWDNVVNKVKNKIESTLIFSETNGTNKAMNLAFAELIDDASLVNKEIDNYLKVTLKQIKEQANLLFIDTKCSTLYYMTKK